MAESHVRSLVKAVTWRAGGTAITFVVAWALSGQTDLAVRIGLLDTGVKFLAFYVHERAWDRSNLGRGKTPDYQI